MALDSEKRQLQLSLVRAIAVVESRITIDVDIKKSVTSACQQICTYLRPFSHYKSQ